MNKIALLLLCMLVGLAACKSKKEVATTTYEQESEMPEKPMKTEDTENNMTKVSVIQDETADLSLKTDAFQLVKMEQKNDSLLVEVRYGGGCREHAFQLVHIGAYKESMPPQLDVALRHNANDDRCRALVTETLVIPLKALQYPGAQKLVLNFQKLNTSRTINF